MPETAEWASSYRSPTLQAANKWGVHAHARSVRIRCDTLALFVSQPAAGGGNADHAKWHVAEMQKNTLELL